MADYPLFEGSSRYAGSNSPPIPVTSLLATPRRRKDVAVSAPITIPSTSCCRAVNSDLEGKAT